MAGKNAGAWTKAVALYWTSSHCILHQYALADERMPGSLKNVFGDAVKMIDLIKSWLKYT